MEQSCVKQNTFYRDTKHRIQYFFCRYICAQNNNDSLALVFYERAREEFKEGKNEWRYAQMLITVAHHHLLRESTTAQIVRVFHVNALHPQAQAQYREVQEAEVLAVARTPVREAVAPADDSYDIYY